MPFRVSTAPTVEPLSLAELKALLRVDHDVDDVLLSGLLTSCRQQLESILGRALVAQTVTINRDYFPVYEICLPRSPALSVSSITYVDSNGTTQTLSSSIYSLDTVSEPNEIVLAYGQVWPTARYQRNSVTATYKAGYATPFTAATTDVLTFAGRAPVGGEVVRVWNSGGALPSGLAASTDYYVINASGQTCKLSLTDGGSAVDITNTGSGLHYAGEIPRAILTELALWVGDSYNNREGQAMPMRKITVAGEHRLWGAYDSAN